MDLKEYFEKAKVFSIIPERLKEVYLSLGLKGETGEVADKLKKLIRDEGIDITRVMNVFDAKIIKEPLKKGILLELGDVMWYLVMISNEVDKYYGSDLGWDGKQKFINYYDFDRIEKSLCELMFNLAEYVENKQIDWAMVYVQAIALRLGSNIEEVMTMNIEKLTGRLERNKIKGNGDYR